MTQRTTIRIRSTPEDAMHLDDRRQMARRLCARARFRPCHGTAAPSTMPRRGSRTGSVPAHRGRRGRCWRCSPIRYPTTAPPNSAAAQSAADALQPHPIASRRHGTAHPPQELLDCQDVDARLRPVRDRLSGEPVRIGRHQMDAADSQRVQRVADGQAGRAERVRPAVRRVGHTGRGRRRCPAGGWVRSSPPEHMSGPNRRPGSANPPDTGPSAETVARQAARACTRRPPAFVNDMRNVN